MTSESDDDLTSFPFGNEDSDSPESTDDEPEGLQYPRIKQYTSLCSCDICRNALRVCFWCSQCNNGEWDMCESCFGKGHWCKSRQHLLAKCFISRGERILYEKNISYTSLKLEQTLLILDTSTGVDQPIRRLARFASKDADLVYESPPTFHPTKPLIVWLRSQTQLLFADFLNHTFFVKKIPVSSKCKLPRFPTRSLIVATNYSHS